MELPIINFPTYIEELSEPFHSLFKQKRQLMQFKRLITGFGIAEKHTIAHMNGLFTNHTNQSNLNRFVTYSDWDLSEMNRIKMCMINEVEKDGIVILDDYIIEKSGKEIKDRLDYQFVIEQFKKLPTEKQINIVLELGIRQDYDFIEEMRKSKLFLENKIEKSYQQI